MYIDTYFSLFALTWLSTSQVKSQCPLVALECDPTGTRHETPSCHIIQACSVHSEVMRPFIVNPI